MPGAVVVQDHMVETHPALVDDCNVRMFTGDDDLADEIDDQYLIDVNKLFPAEQAEEIKAAMGKTSWQAIHIPTIVSRTCGRRYHLQVERHAAHHDPHRRVQHVRR